jgi:cellobiose dehydrogenase (acceptor)
MTRTLLLMAYPNNGNILTQFMYAAGYDMPAKYTGNAKLTQISSTIASDSYTLIFRCQNCFQWNQNGDTGSVSTSSGLLVLGWAHAYSSPTNPACPDTISLVQHDYQSIFGAPLDSNVANPSYSSWAALATKTVTGNCGGTTSTSTSTLSSSTSTSTTGPTGVPVPTGTYDYVVVGGGAGGIPLADKLSESGKKVLLIEKGPPSSGRWGGSRKPDWLQGTNLTRFDVPGLCNEIWHDSSGIACTDTDQMAGCVLGGGTAVNAGLWWKVCFSSPHGSRLLTLTAEPERLGLQLPLGLEGKRHLRRHQPRLRPHSRHDSSVQGRQALSAAGLRRRVWRTAERGLVPGRPHEQP